MYEICDYDDRTHVYARVQNLDDVDEAIEALLDVTRQQLLANGEGATQFHLRLAIYDEEKGMVQTCARWIE